MSIASSIKSLLTIDPAFRSKSVSTATYQGGLSEAFGPLGQRNADWSTIANMPRLQDSYRKCATAYACLSLLADAVTESPLRVYQTVDGEPEERPTHRLRTLLANPNPLMSEAEFMSMLVMVMGMYGYGVIEKVRSSARMPVQLWPLRPDWLISERAGERVKLTYRRPGTDARVIDAEDLLLIPYRHDERFSQIGVSPLQIVAREIGIDVSLTDLLKVFIDSGGIPPWVVKFSGDIQMDQAAKDVFRTKWSQMFGGHRAYSTIGVLDPGMDLVKVGDSIGTMAWPDLRSLTELKICQAFRVPPDLVFAKDTLSGGSLTTTEHRGAMAVLQNHGAQPLRQRIDGAFTRSLMADFGMDPSFSLEFDTSAILALQEDEDKRHGRIRADWDAGLITWNEARQAIDYPDLGSDGEVVKLSFTTTLQPISGANGTGATERAALLARDDTQLLALPGRPKRMTGTLTFHAGEFARQYRDLKALSPADLETRASILATTRKDREKLIQIGTRQLKKFFTAQGKRIVAAMPKASGAVIDAKAVPIDWDDEDDILRELLLRYYGANGEAAFGTASATLDSVIAWDLANPRIATLVNELGLRIVGINETTRQDVVRTITNGQAEGMNLQQISDSIRDLFEQSYKSRAETVARTETQVSYNLASKLAYQESGVVDQVELSDNPDHVEGYGASDGLTCAERHGLVVPVGDIDRHSYAEHPNGSLAVIPLLATPLGET